MAKLTTPFKAVLDIQTAPLQPVGQELADMRAARVI